MLFPSLSFFFLPPFQFLFLDRCVLTGPHAVEIVHIARVETSHTVHVDSEDRAI